jgi:hypothetical protein
MLRTCSEPDLTKLDGDSESKPAKTSDFKTAMVKPNQQFGSTGRLARSLEDLAEVIQQIEASEVFRFFKFSEFEMKF